jgi:preprotein translocase subunit SecG
MLANLLTLLLGLISLFLMFIILLQRGRGGGLTGALGGLGGQSAFGTKAGDVFTRITVVVAVLWVVLNCVSIFTNRAVAERGYANRQGAEPVKTAPEKPASESAPAAAPSGAAADKDGPALPDTAPAKPAADAKAPAGAAATKEAAPTGGAKTAPSPATPQGTSDKKSPVPAEKE